MKMFNLAQLFIYLALFALSLAGPISSTDTITTTNYTSHAATFDHEFPGPNRRGIAYNNVNYVTLFNDDHRHTSWCYNWDSRPYHDTPIEFVPMLHSIRDDHTGPWLDNAKRSIYGDTKAPTHILGFNEPDNCIAGAGGSCISVDDAVAGWKEHIQPLKSTKRAMYLGSPAVTNAPDTPTTGLGWLRSFLEKCSGCDVDFIAIHWYDIGTNVAYFKQHVNAAREVAQGRPIWITEFGVHESERAVKGFLQEVMPWLDGSADVHRYAYFMATVGEGFLINDNGDGLSDLGKAYQFD